ncbi:PREDICTED: E3 ubiquitin-protein ligase RNF14-like [Nelumbo nucifera]|uniref:E3 ubiquitin-protein ligase RNF14-like n=1 Tax=Nelumbo nucifera TaxID=4432 RepID=A0A1U8Q941_NELNU|nr:PREDICTED: E3 ubiquitin-protein ligase RNF14-like [Nelumbo nucifera]
MATPPSHAEEEIEPTPSSSSNTLKKEIFIKQYSLPSFKPNIPSVNEIGQSSNSQKPTTFICDICVESKSLNQSFCIKGCTHAYCCDCIVKYVASKLQENVTSIHCPEPTCNAVLEPEFSHLTLPPEEFDRWENALCENLIIGSQRFYCPFKDCSALCGFAFCYKCGAPNNHNYHYCSKCGY